MNISPKEASNVLSRHFSEVSSADFVGRVGQHCSTLAKPGDLVPAGEDGDDTSDQIVLFRSRPSPLPLDAYLASALTGLSSEQREIVFNLSDVIAEVCKAHHIDLYEPRKAGTDPLVSLSQHRRRRGAWIRILCANTDRFGCP